MENILDDFITKSNINKDNIDEVILIGGSTLIPKIREIIKEKFEKSKVKFDLDPKEVVARGAAIRGAKFLNISSVSNIKLFDVTNLPLGVNQKGNIFGIILPRSIEILLDKQKNLLLGKYEISGFPKREAGKVEIEIKMHIKKNSILEITAWQKDNE